MTGRPNAAIVFAPDAYDAGRKQVMGRHVAGASFLEGFVRHSGVDRIVGVAFQNTIDKSFRPQVEAAVAGTPGLAERPVQTLTMRDLGAIEDVGTLFIPDPQLPRFAAIRRHRSQRAYSLCGITHTISSRGVMETLCEMLTGPVQSWDALICTSQAVRKAVLRQQEHYGDYLEQRMGVRSSSPVQTPVIPLGVDAARFERLGSDAAARARLRAQIGAAENDTVVLFLGRLAFHAKAHPVPMYIGAQRAARRLGPADGRIHLVQTGQFPNQVAEDGYRAGAERFCPDVAVHFLDGADPALADASWAAADVFVTLSDNIQESFGITPVEAMAAGLPCIVSDWDGYRDTVVDGETGFRIKTWLPQGGVGASLADAYTLETLSYDLYIGYASQMTVVEVPAFADALEALARDPDRRRRMGEAGRSRVRAHYDWSVVVRAYQDLWAELAERRRTDAEIAPPRWQVRNSRVTDPFDVFAGHAGTVLPPGGSVRLDPDGVAVEDLAAMPANMFAADALLGVEEIVGLVDLIRSGKSTMQDCLRAVPADRRVRVVRSLHWLAKYGVVSLGDGEAAPDRGNQE